MVVAHGTRHTLYTRHMICHAAPCCEVLRGAMRCGRTAEFGAATQGKLARGLEVGHGLLGHGGLDLVSSRARATAHLIHGRP